MSTKISQKDYLKKYLSNDKKHTKKKKSQYKANKTAAKVTIIDDDENEFREIHEIEEGEDAPQIVAEYIEQQSVASNKWRSFAVKEEKQDCDADDSLNPWNKSLEADKSMFVSEHRQSRLPKEEKFDGSPSWRQAHTNSRTHRSSTSIHSPSRKYNDDQSPPRRSNHIKIERSPPVTSRKHQDDLSPPRRREIALSSAMKLDKSNSSSNDKERSSSNKRRKSTELPPSTPMYIAKIKKERDIDERRSTSPASTQRSKITKTLDRKRVSMCSPSRSYNDDQSPPRRKHNRTDRSPPLISRQHQDDLSPPRRRERPLSPAIKRDMPNSPINKNRKIDSAHSSSNKHRKSMESLRSVPMLSKIKKERKLDERFSVSPPPTHSSKSTKTLDGKRAGLQDAASLRQEIEERHRQAAGKQVPTDENAEIQVRSTGRRGKKAREAQEMDPEQQKRKELREEYKQEVYSRWGKGLKQIEDHRTLLAEQEYEGNKPLARYSNDADLEQHLRDQERVDDPMLEYMRQKKREKQTNSKVPSVPLYEGAFTENRFGIRPGYRWDGVDRSNGYEDKWFNVQNEKQARVDEAYKYSVEDM